MKNWNGCSPRPRENNEEFTSNWRKFLNFTQFYSDTKVVLPDVQKCESFWYILYLCITNYLFNIVLIILFFTCKLNRGAAWTTWNKQTKFSAMILIKCQIQKWLHCVVCWPFQIPLQCFIHRKHNFHTHFKPLYTTATGKLKVKCWNISYYHFVCCSSSAKLPFWHILRLLNN